MTPKEYDALVRQLSPSSPVGKDTALAFVVGGGICAVGQLIANGWQALGLTQQEAITGFANAVASPALEFKSEGLITGMAAKMFLIAGPVIVFGTAASVVYGLVLYLLA